MKREFLQSLELSEEVINQIMAEHGKTIQATQEKLSAAEAQLNEANATLATLKKNNKDNEELQNELRSYKERTDVDYLMFKLGDLEVDDEGNVKDLENKIKDLKASLPNFFEQSSEPPKEPEGFTKLGGAGLGGGKTPQETSLESILANPEANLTQFLQQQNK